jgi:Fic family protein
MGYRKEGGFIGTRDRQSSMPIPVHISAKSQDLKLLMPGLIEAASLFKKSNYPAILAATVIAFGFVFIHPFEDANGRIHRYLIHHVLSETGFTPAGIVFPISVVILRRILDYKKVLEAYSKPILPYIEWRPTQNGNVEILNETIDFYRYFDATTQAEFLCECIEETIDKALPAEIDYLKKYDLMKGFINSYLEMPDHMIDLLINFLNQNQGKLSKRARAKEFAKLSEKEVTSLEAKFSEVFAVSMNL